MGSSGRGYGPATCLAAPCHAPRLVLGAREGACGGESARCQMPEALPCMFVATSRRHWRDGGAAWFVVRARRIKDAARTFFPLLWYCRCSSLLLLLALAVELSYCLARSTICVMLYDAACHASYFGPLLFDCPAGRVGLLLHLSERGSRSEQATCASHMCVRSALTKFCHKFFAADKRASKHACATDSVRTAPFDFARSRSVLLASTALAWGRGIICAPRAGAWAVGQRAFWGHVGREPEQAGCGLPVDELWMSFLVVGRRGGAY